MDFQYSKTKQLGKSDKSSIGSWDSTIKSLCEKINRRKNFYTTSSCGGRVVLLKSSDKKIRDAFLFRTHSLVNFSELKKALVDVGKKYKGLVEFQQTSCILHVACASVEDAFSLVNKAKEAGWKRSGLMSSSCERSMVELHSTESISFPIMVSGKILVDDEFLKIVVKEANSKLKRTWKKIERLKRGV